ncbi:hypothetical protein PAXINDRAFT_96726 [Paxillus involutus ATCC 200175]|nr:hypothetical protein PAXINDRAFT_96726 [Paxillus involutus ATCC 200175]
MTPRKYRPRSRPGADDASDDNTSVGDPQSDGNSSDSSHLRTHPRAPEGGKKSGQQNSQDKNDYVPYVTRRVMKLVMSDALPSPTHRQDAKSKLARKPPEEDEMLRELQSQMERLSTTSTTEIPSVPSPSPPPSNVHRDLPDTTQNTSAEPSASSYIHGELESYIEEWRSQIPNLTGRVSKVEKHPVAFGGFSDIWSCVLERSSYLSLRGDTTDDDFDELEMNGDPMVAVKAVRIHAGADEDGVRKCKRLFRETEVWKRLKHPNILPLFGVTFGFGPLPALRDQLSQSDRWGLLSDTISGLNYLHSESVVHGDLSGSNILIDRYGHARFADFGLSTILLEFVGKSFLTSTVKGSIRWAAPELFCFLENESTVPAPSQASDIYSFGSIVFQVLTGEVPYSHLKSDVQVIFTVSKGMTPPRPASSGCVSEPQWKFIQQCWSKPQTARPTSAEVAQFVDSQYLESVWNDER